MKLSIKVAIFFFPGVPQYSNCAVGLKCIGNVLTIIYMFEPAAASYANKQNISIGYIAIESQAILYS